MRFDGQVLEVLELGKNFPIQLHVERALQQD
jgi:hypothetical protein